MGFLDEFEWDPEQIPKLKLGLHIVQIVFSFVIFCLEIAVFKSDGSSIIASNAWPFAVCFLSVPVWIYLIMTPRFPRTRKVAHPTAMVGVDAVFTIVWLSAFACQASYNTRNLCGTGCSLSKTIVGLGFFVFLFFVGTTILSVWTMRYWQWNNRLPGYDDFQNSPHSQNIDPDKAAFSTGPLNEESAYSPVAMNDQDHDPDHDDHSDLGVSSGAADPYGPPSTNAPPEDPFHGHDNPFHADNEYHSTVGAPSSLSGHAPPTSYPDEPAIFPSANYDRIERR